MAVDPSELDRLIEDAGIGARNAKKLRDANNVTPSPSKGHGAPAPIVRTRGGI